MPLLTNRYMLFGCKSLIRHTAKHHYAWLLFLATFNLWAAKLKDLAAKLKDLTSLEADDVGRTALCLLTDLTSAVTGRDLILLKLVWSIHK